MEFEMYKVLKYIYYPHVTGSASMRVDAILGQGAFATVYQATDPMTSTKAVLKVRD